MKAFKKIWENKPVLFLLIILFLVVLLKTAPKPLPPTSIPATPKPPRYLLPTATPLAKPPMTPFSAPPSQAKLQEIISRLPYRGESFDIKYYQENKKFVVVVRKGPLDQTINEVKNWFQSQGIDDFSQLKISWEPTREVLNELGVPPPIPEP